MTDTLSTKPLDSLTAELFDFLGLGPDIDLPTLDRATLSRSQRDDGWKVDAYPNERDAASAIDAVNGWALFAGSQVRLMTPYKSSIQPSGWQVSLSTAVVVGGVRIGIHANLDADRYAEAMTADMEHTHVIGESVHVVYGGARCSECSPEPVRVTGAFADFLLGEDVTA